MNKIHTLLVIVTSVISTLFVVYLFEEKPQKQSYQPDNQETATVLTAQETKQSAEKLP